MQADLCAAIGGLQEEMRLARKRWQEMAANCWPVNIAGIGGIPAAGALTLIDPNLMGPKTGYAWLVQRITVGGLASGTTFDTAFLYRGKSVDAIQPNALLNLVTGNSPTWHPGSLGLILRDGETVIMKGTGLTATGLIALSMDVIQVATPTLSEYLL